MLHFITKKYIIVFYRVVLGSRWTEIIMATVHIKLVSYSIGVDIDFSLEDSVTINKV